MATILIRTIIVYAILMLAIKLMGKRQLGELQMSEFVIALIIAELVANPVMDSDVPLVFVLTAVITLVAIEVIMSYISMNARFMRPSPCILIEKGEIKHQNLKSMRLALSELISEIRLKNYPDVSMIDYAILEPNGKISVIAKPEYQAATAAQLNLAYENAGIAHPVIINGELNLRSIAEAGKTSEWVLHEMAAQGYSAISDIFLMSVDNSGNIYICPAQPDKKGA